eukprot:272584-Amphidinium_carterae.2
MVSQASLGPNALITVDHMMTSQQRVLDHCWWHLRGSLNWICIPRYYSRNEAPGSVDSEFRRKIET